MTSRRSRRASPRSRALEDPKVWDDPKRAQELGKEKKAARRRRRHASPASTPACATRRSSSSSRATRTTTRRSSQSSATSPASRKRSPDMEFRRMFSDPLDPTNCFVDIQAGAGGTEAQDWAQMLERMYVQLLRAQGLQGRDPRAVRGRGRRDQERDAQGDRRLRVRPPPHRDRHPSPGAQVAVRLERAPPHLFRQRVRLPRGRRDDRDRHQPGRPPHRYLPRLRRRRPAREPNRLGGADHAHPDAASSCSARTTARSTATAPRRWRC